jgi:transposase InsO family protein
MPRRQLGELVPQIGNWYFASKTQYYLHECGKITLGGLHISISTLWINRNGFPIPIVKSQVFERIHSDFAGPCSDGSTYLIIVDSYSKWPEVFKMPNMSAAATVICMRSFVHRFGIPKEIVSDNGTQFRSAEFAQFCQEFGIKQTFIPPFHPQSNGQAERFVDTFKRSME